MAAKFLIKSAGKKSRKIVGEKWWQKISEKKIKNKFNFFLNGVKNHKRTKRKN